MLGFLVRTAIVAVGLSLAAAVVPSMAFRDTGTLLWASLLLGVVNAVVRPLIVFVTLPLTVVTLGLFLLVVNASMLMLVARLLDGFSLGGFWAAFFAGIIVSITSGIASWYVGPKGRFEVVVLERHR